MVKKLTALVLALLALVLPCVAMAGAYVVDDAELFSQQEEAEIDEVIQRIRQEYQMDVVVLTSQNVPYGRSQDYADLYYENNGYGQGDDDAGLLYLIDMYNRVPCISTTGTMMDFITDARLEALFDCSYDQLAWGDYAGSTLALLSQLENYLRQGVQEGTFRFDAATGQRLSGVYNVLTGSEYAVALLAGVAAAAGMFAVVSRRYNLRGSTYRYDRAANAQRQLTKDEETFQRESVSVIRHSSNNGGHGGSGGGGSGVRVHRSFSGRSHGGGVGRRF